MSDGGWGSGPWGGSAWGKSYFVPTISEGASGTDTSTLALLISRSVSEGAAVAELLLGARQGFFTEATEAVAALDAAPVAGSAYLLDVHEGAVAADEVRSNAVFPVAVDEAASLEDTVPAKFLWDPVNDNQPSNWQNVDNTQTPGWSNVIDTQPSQWRDVEP